MQDGRFKYNDKALKIALTEGHTLNLYAATDHEEE